MGWWESYTPYTVCSWANVHLYHYVFSATFAKLTKRNKILCNIYLANLSSLSIIIFFLLLQQSYQGFCFDNGFNSYIYHAQLLFLPNRVTVQSTKNSMSGTERPKLDGVIQMGMSPNSNDFYSSSFWRPPARDVTSSYVLISDRKPALARAHTTLKWRKHPSRLTFSGSMGTGLSCVT